jgi:hypothetical protein
LEDYFQGKRTCASITADFGRLLSSEPQPPNRGRPAQGRPALELLVRRGIVQFANLRDQDAKA